MGFVWLCVKLQCLDIIAMNYLQNVLLYGNIFVMLIVCISFKKNYVIGETKIDD